MADKLHSTASVGARHPIHNWEDATIAARDLRTYTDAHIGMVSKVATPPGFHVLLSQSGGVGTFRPMLEDIAPASEEETGRLWLSKPTYIQNFTGTSGTPLTTEALTSSGDIDKVVQIFGWINDGTRDSSISHTAFTSANAAQIGVITNDIQLTTVGIYSSKPYEISCEYTKT